MDEDADAKTLFGERVKELREAQGLSINRLALVCGMNNTYLGWVERGQVNISIKIQSKIAIVKLTQRQRQVNISIKIQSKIASALGVQVWELFASAEVVDIVKGSIRDNKP